MQPAHGEWCGARTWPTNCPTCSEPVFFFMCNCGSKVYFDSLGDPWPLHDCDTSWTRALPRSNSSRGVTVHLSASVSVTRPSEKPRISSFESFGGETRRRERDAISAIRPIRGASKEIIGVLRELDRQLSVIRAMRLEETSMTFALLGPLGSQPMGRITIHVPAGSGVFESYTAWVPTELIEDPRIRRGVTLAARLESMSVPDGKRVWFCDALSLIG